MTDHAWLHARTLLLQDGQVVVPIADAIKYAEGLRHERDLWRKNAEDAYAERQRHDVTDVRERIEAMRPWPDGEALLRALSDYADAIEYASHTRER